MMQNIVKATSKGFVKPHNIRSFTNIVKENLVVNSHNEFDPLEEVIVGRVEGSTIPEWHVSGKAVWPTKYWDMYKTKSGQPFPADLTKNGKIVTICFQTFNSFLNYSYH